MTLSFLQRRTRPLLFLVAFLASPFAIAQPSWVRDALAKPLTTTIDPAATSITLVDTRAVQIQADGHSRIHVRRLVKHLKTPSRDASVIAEHTTELRTVEHMRGWLIPQTGDVRDLPSENVVSVGQSDIRGYYDESKQLIAVIPNVHAGDAVAFEYDIQDDDRTAAVQGFLIQVQQPVLYGEYSVELPEGWKLHSSARNIAGIEYTEQDRRCVWRAVDLPFRPEEPLSPDWSYLRRSVVIMAFNPASADADVYRSWSGVVRWAERRLNPKVLVDDAITKETLELTRAAATPLERARLLAQHVRDQFRYVAIEVGEGRWEPHGSPEVLKNRFGDCKDKVTLLRAMLQSSGITSFPVLLNTEAAVDSATPSPYQFNHVIVAIPWGGLSGDTARLPGATVDGYLFFDPTDEATPFGALPVHEQGAMVLVCAPGNARLTELPYSDPWSNHRWYEAHVEIMRSGAVSGSVQFLARGAIAHRLRHQFGTMPVLDQQAFLRSAFASTLGEIALSNFRYSAGEDSFLVLATFSASRGVASSGSTRIVAMNFFHESDYPALTGQARTHPIWFGGPFTETSDITVTVPETWTLGPLLPSKQSSCLDVARVEYRVTKSANDVRFVSQTTNSGYLIKASEYPAAKAFNKDMRACYNLTLLFQEQ